jgi:hypothetical protein
VWDALVGHLGVGNGVTFWRKAVAEPVFRRDPV